MSRPLIPRFFSEAVASSKAAVSSSTCAEFVPNPVPESSSTSRKMANARPAQKPQKPVQNAVWDLNLRL
jgi:hypothetical protein